MKVAKRHSTVKTVREAKAKATQKQRAKVHKVKKEPSQAQASPSQETDIQEEQEEEQQEEQQGECQEDEDETTDKGKAQVCAMVYYHFWKCLLEAPRPMQEAVQKVKDQPARFGKEKQLTDMAKAYATQKWGHKLFKSLQHERSKAKEDIVMPKVIMVAKKVGKSASEQAPCLVNSNVLS